MPDENKTNEKELSPLAQKAAEIDEGRWTLYQNIGGVVLGLAAGALLFLVKDDGSLLPLNFIIALAIAKFLPDYLEKQMNRSLRRARIVMIITLLIVILAWAGYIFLIKGTAAFTANP